MGRACVHIRESGKAAMTNSAPIITSNGGGTTASISVAENGTAVTTVTATDVDGQTLIYSISGTDAAKFSINSSTGVLTRSEEHTSELQSHSDLVCRLL